MEEKLQRITAFVPRGHLRFSASRRCVILETRNATEIRANGKPAGIGTKLSAGDILQAFGGGNDNVEVVVRFVEKDS